MRLATPFAILALVALLLSGCGGSSDGTTSSSAPEGGSSVAKVRAAWEDSSDCERPAGASRWGCSVGPYRCQSVVSDRGWSTSCSKPGRSISFTVRP
jgi:hypothetical protein